MRERTHRLGYLEKLCLLVRCCRVLWSCHGGAACTHLHASATARLQAAPGHPLAAQALPLRKTATKKNKSERALGTWGACPIYCEDCLIMLPTPMGLAPFCQSFMSALCSEGWRKCTENSCSLQNRPRRLFAVNKNFHHSDLSAINWSGEVTFLKDISLTLPQQERGRGIFVQLWSAVILQICPL